MTHLNIDIFGAMSKPITVSMVSPQIGLLTKSDSQVSPCTVKGPKVSAALMFLRNEPSLPWPLKLILGKWPFWGLMTCDMELKKIVTSDMIISYNQ